MSSYNKFPSRLVFIGMLASAALIGCSPQAAPPPNPGAAATPVTVVTLKTEPVTLTRELPGRTNASLVAEVRPQANGIIKRRLFTEGGPVKAGQPLYQLDDATYQADLASAQAALARAQASLNSARLNATRSAELAKIDAISRQDNENATAALLQAEADVKAAQAAVQRNGIVLDYARITSPIGGRIGKSSVTQGALVTANQAAAAGHRAATRSDLCRPDAVQQRAAAAAQGAGRRHPDRHPQRPGHDPAGGRQPIQAPRQAGLRRCDRRSGHRQLLAARDCSQSGQHPAAGHVRARRGRQRRAPKASWCRSRASRAIRRAMPPRWWSARTTRSNRARSRPAAPSATNGWSMAAWPPATA